VNFSFGYKLPQEFYVFDSLFVLTVYGSPTAAAHLVLIDSNAALSLSA